MSMLKESPLQRGPIETTEMQLTGVDIHLPSSL